MKSIITVAVCLVGLVFLSACDKSNNPNEKIRQQAAALNEEARTRLAALEAPPAAAIPFKGQIYRSVDDATIITIISADELELTQPSSGFVNLICKYTRQDDSIRAVLTSMGTTRALYLQVTSEGLVGGEGTSGRTFYNPTAYTAAKQALVAKQQTERMSAARALDAALQKRNGYYDDATDILRQNPELAKLKGSIFFGNTIKYQPTSRDTEFLKLLCELGADVNYEGRGELPQTPLMLACQYADTNQIELLLKFGAQTDILGSGGEYAAQIARDNNSRVGHDWSVHFQIDDSVLTRLLPTWDRSSRTNAVFRVYNLERDTYKRITGSNILTDTGYGPFFFGEVRNLDKQYSENGFGINVFTITSAGVNYPSYFDSKDDRDKAFKQITEAMADWIVKYRFSTLAKDNPINRSDNGSNSSATFVITVKFWNGSDSTYSRFLCFDSIEERDQLYQELRSKYKAWQTGQAVSAK